MKTERSLYYDRLQALTRRKHDGEVVSLGGYEGGAKVYIKVFPTGSAFLLVYVVNLLVTQVKIDRVLTKISEDGYTITAHLDCQLKKTRRREYEFRFFDESSAKSFYSSYTRALILNGYDEEAIPSFEDIQEEVEYDDVEDSHNVSNHDGSNDDDDSSNVPFDDFEPSQDLFSLNTIHPFKKNE